MKQSKSMLFRDCIYKVEKDNGKYYLLRDDVRIGVVDKPLFQMVVDMCTEIDTNEVIVSLKEAK